MNTAVVKRLIIFAAGIVGFFALFLVINLMRFSPQQWFEQRLSSEWIEAVNGKFSSERLGTTLQWQALEINSEQFNFLADQLSIEFNTLSVAVGKPAVAQLTIDSPYLELSDKVNTLTAVKAFMQMGFQNIDIRNAVLVIDGIEVSDIELSLLKNGVFGEYASQLSAQLHHESLSASLSFSTLLGIDGNDQLVMGKNQFDAELTLPNWDGRIAGKVKTAFISEQRAVEFKFVNWSSSWQSDLPELPYTYDWAGGLNGGSYHQQNWNVNTLDSAVAFVDDQNVGHTFAVQSNESDLVQGDLIGQLGLSLLVQYPENSDLQSYNFVMSGAMEPDTSIYQWADPSIRFSTIDAEGVQQTHYIDVRQFNLDPEQNQWQLIDGEWRLSKNEQPAGDFGFGELQGHWPSLTLTRSPKVAERLQPALTLLAEDVEELNALFKHLVQ